MHMNHAKPGDQVIVRGKDWAVIDRVGCQGAGILVRFHDGRREVVPYRDLELVDVPPAGEAPGLIRK